MPVSAVDCIQPALHHTRSQLFTHFRWGQWSRLALVGILAAELHVGGCGFGNLGADGHMLRTRLKIHSCSRACLRVFRPSIQLIFRSISGNLLALILLGMLAVFVLGFIFLYISSVFRFILFDSVVRRECSISDGWNRYRRAGGRYFLWQIVLQISVWVLMFLLLGVPLAIAFAAGWMTDLRPTCSAADCRSASPGWSLLVFCAGRSRGSDAGQGFSGADHGARGSRFRRWLASFARNDPARRREASRSTCC